MAQLDPRLMSYTSRAFALALLAVAVAACLSDKGSADPRDARSASEDSGNAVFPDGGKGEGDGSSDLCQRNDDCWLAPRGCCAACNPTLDDVIALSVGSLSSDCAVACGPCASDSEAIPAQLQASCEAGHCVAHDLRAEDVSRCNQDSDCEARPSGCCPSCTPAQGWLALTKGAKNVTELECNPSPPCLACVDSAPPEVYCASDHHCAIRSCFSPTHNLDSAYALGARGCVCSPGDAAVCLPDSTGRLVALICTDGAWRSVEDGPCGF